MNDMKKITKKYSEEKKGEKNFFFFFFVEYMGNEINSKNQ